MTKLKMHSPNRVDENIEKIGKLFPNCLTERKNEAGEVEFAIDFDVLRQELSSVVVEGNEERYQFTWPDKRQSVLLANAPIAKTLRPCREESVDFDTTENLYIEGDNLDVLKLLQETYLGRVKMIYIDPPYNTGNDFVYNDKFVVSSGEWEEMSGQYDEEGNRLVQNNESNGRFHTDWLNMIYPRLKLAKDLLSDDGVIFISIDDNEVRNLRIACDEVFGESNFVANIIWQKKTGASDAKGIAIITEYVCIYCRDSSFFNQTFTKNTESYDLSRYKFADEFVEERGKYYIDNLDRGGLQYSDSLNYGIECPDGSITYPNGRSEFENDGWIWKWSKQKIEWARQNKFIEFRKSSNKGSGWSVCYKNYLNVDNENNIITRAAPHKNMIIDILNANAAASMKELFATNNYFNYSKPYDLIKRLVSYIECKDSIILDFFSGSATTAHAVMQLNAEDDGNRKFIMVQLPEATDEKSESYKAGYKNICEIGKERIRRAGKKVISDKWEVISKDIVGGKWEEISQLKFEQYGCTEFVKNSTNHYTLHTNNYHESTELSRTDCLAKVNGGNQTDLFNHQETSTGRVVCPVQSNEESRNLNSIEHSGGTSTQLNQGVHSISCNSQRIESGAGDATNALRENLLPCRFGYFGSNEPSSIDRKNAQCPQKGTIHCPLITNHYSLDTGFRVLKLDSTNMKEVYYDPSLYTAELFSSLADNIKDDRTPEDLLFQVMLDLGVLPSSKIEESVIDGKKVFNVENNYLIACFDSNVTDATVTAIAKQKPYYFVMRDSSLASDSVATNFEQIFATYSNDTIRKVL